MSHANISMFKGKNICCNTNFSGSKLTKLYHFVYISPQNCSTIILNNDMALGVPGLSSLLSSKTSTRCTEHLVYKQVSVINKLYTTLVQNNICLLSERISIFMNFFKFWILYFRNFKWFCFLLFGKFYSPVHQLWWVKNSISALEIKLFAHICIYVYLYMYI